MSVRTLVVAMLLLGVPAAHACINSVGTDHAGRRFDADWYTGEDMTQALSERGQRRYMLDNARTIAESARKQPDFSNLTDLGVLLIYQGQYGSAIRHFLVIEKRFPGRHQTAANLGTALELAGHDDVALRWIRIGIQRNQEEHLRSEWLHVRILEAKIALSKDPNYLKNRSVAGVIFEKTLVPPIPSAMPMGNDGKPVEPWELDRSLSYQLHERTQFLAPPDPIVANLLSDWATLNLAGGPVENADALYRQAVRYGVPRDDLMRNRHEYIARTLAQADRETSAIRCSICQPLSGADD
jgi:tetratricopeptide (TPR) repeat protein